MKRKKLVLIAIILLVLSGITLFMFCRNQDSFSGSRVKNPDEYLLDIRQMNSKDVHTLELKKDDVLQIHFETTKGSLNLEIKAPDQTAIYSGNGKEATDFAVKIPKNGVYTIVVNARHAKGNIHIKLKEEV